MKLAACLFALALGAWAHNLRKNALNPTTHTLPMARASAGARGLTTEDGARSTQTSSSAGSKGVWL